MEKCVFIGYPQGYKGWKFYNPVTKKVVISERADFDEWFFMLQRHSVPHLPPPQPNSLLETPTTTLSLPDLSEEFFDTHTDSQKPVHGGDGSTASDLPSVPPILPPIASVHSHSPPSMYHSLPPSTPSPSTPPAHHPPIPPPLFCSPLVSSVTQGPFIARILTVIWLEASRQGLEQDPSFCALIYGLQLCPIQPWALHLPQG